MKNALIYLAIIALIFISFKVGQRFPHKSPTNDNLRDTVYLSVIDTNSVSNPDYSSERGTDTIKIPVPFPVYFPPDTIEHRDTITQYVYLPRTERVYKGEDYRAVVSGYEPRLDSIDIYHRTEYITITETVKEPIKNWSFDVSGGIVVSGGKKIVPYTGLELTFKRVTIQGGVSLDFAPEIKLQPYIEAKYTIVKF